MNVVCSLYVRRWTLLVTGTRHVTNWMVKPYFEAICNNINTTLLCSPKSLKNPVLALYVSGKIITAINLHTLWGMFNICALVKELKHHALRNIFTNFLIWMCCICMLLAEHFDTFGVWCFGYCCMPRVNTILGNGLRWQWQQQRRQGQQWQLWWQWQTTAVAVMTSATITTAGSAESLLVSFIMRPDCELYKHKFTGSWHLKYLQWPHLQISKAKYFHFKREPAMEVDYFAALALKKCWELSKKNEKYLGQARCQAQISNKLKYNSAISHIHCGL